MQAVIQIESLISSLVTH